VRTYRKVWALPSMAALAVAAFLGGATPARADLEIILQEGATKTYYSVSTGGGTGGFSPGFTTNFGDFTITLLGASQTNASTSQLLASNLSVVNNDKTNAHTLSITTYGNGYTMPTGSPLNLTSSAGGDVIGGTATMAHQGWINNATPAIDAPPGPGVPGLVPPEETSPGSQAPVFNGNSFDNGTLNASFARLGAGYSLTEQALVAVGAGGSIHFTETLTVTATPEPCTTILLLTALPALGAGYLARRRKNRLELAA